MVRGQIRSKGGLFSSLRKRFRLGPGKSNGATRISAEHLLHDALRKGILVDHSDSYIRVPEVSFQELNLEFDMVISRSINRCMLASSTQVSSS